MRVIIAHVHENIYDGEADSLTVPTSDGEVTILSHHEPYVSTLRPGKIIVRSGGNTQEFEAVDGILEVSSNQVTILL